MMRIIAAGPSLSQLCYPTAWETVLLPTLQETRQLHRGGNGHHVVITRQSHLIAPRTMNFIQWCACFQKAYWRVQFKIVGQFIKKSKHQQVDCTYWCPFLLGGIEFDRTSTKIMLNEGGAARYLGFHCNDSRVWCMCPLMPCLAWELINGSVTKIVYPSLHSTLSAVTKLCPLSKSHLIPHVFPMLILQTLDDSWQR